MKKIKLFSVIALAAMFVACTNTPEDPTSIKFTSANNVNVETGGELNFDVTVKVINPQGDTEFAFQNLPEWVSKTEGDNKVTLSGAAPAEAGVFTVTVKASNNKESVTQTLTINVGGEVSTGDGDGTKESPYNVAQTIGFYTAGTEADKDGVWVKGYIVGGIIYDPATPDSTDYQTTSIDGPEDVVFGTDVRNTAVLIADSQDETDYTNCVAVNLPSGNIRNIVNLRSNTGNLKKMLAVKGNLARYFAVPGVRDLTDFDLEGYVAPTTPDVPVYASKFLEESLGDATSFDKFTAVSVSGAEVWNLNSSYVCTQISGFTGGASHQNEDWLISPAIDLSGQTDVIMSFEHARGPAPSITVGIAEGWYKVYATANYTDVANSTWVEVPNVYHGTGAWAFVNTGALNIPASAISATTRVAFKYLCSDQASATWEMKNLVVGKQ
ncbi:MAG: DUF6359 domain-containing protein [Prevotellaceae bacterium]|jgi:hypothetical protein|nr:DUF6359 domain-containing protein [Prevotellaceae bacterium]